LIPLSNDPGNRAVTFPMKALTNQNNQCPFRPLPRSSDQQMLQFLANTRNTNAAPRHQIDLLTTA
jgi:hypothetical protein